MESRTFLLEKLNRVEKFLGLPLTTDKLKLQEIKNRLKDIRIKYNVII
jgi:hypothetical protein